MKIQEIRTYLMQVGAPPLTAWAADGSFGSHEAAAPSSRNWLFVRVVTKVAAIREALGSRVDIMVDLHGPPWLTPSDAIRMGRALEPFDLLFLEDPIAPDNVEGYKRIRDQLAIPLAAGERMAAIWGLRPPIEQELVDVVQPDTGRAGGILQLRKIAAMAEAHYISVAPHSGSLGPVAEYAALHFLASIPNCLMLERIEDDWPVR